MSSYARGLPRWRQLVVGSALLCATACGDDAAVPGHDGAAPTDTGADVAADAALDAVSDVGLPDGRSDGAADAAGDGAGGVCIDAPTPGDHEVLCDGLRYIFSVPGRCPDAGCGLIVDVHGLSMNAEMEENNTDLRSRGVAAGYVVIQPSAPGSPPFTSWNAENHDDKVFAFMMEVSSVYAVDPARLHVTGFSQGGYMSWRFLCAHSDVLASVAPGAAATGCVNLETLGGCFGDQGDPAEQIDVLYMHGTEELTFVPYFCAIRQRDAVISAWEMTQVASDTGEGFERIRYESAAGAVFEMLSHDYLSTALPSIPASPLLYGHCYPGSDDPGDLPGQAVSFACEGDNSFHWGEEVLRFFDAHPRD